MKTSYNMLFCLFATVLLAGCGSDTPPPEQAEKEQEMFQSEDYKAQMEGTATTE